MGLTGCLYVHNGVALTVRLIQDTHTHTYLLRGVARTADDKHLFMAYDNKLKMGILPVSVFGSGHTFFTQRMWKKLKLEVCMVCVRVCVCMRTARADR